MSYAKPAVVALALLVSSCGFQLRGTASLPFDTLYVPNTSGGIGLDLKRNIEAGTRTRVVSDPQQAQAQLSFTQEVREKHILSLAATGRVSEFQLRYRVSFRLHDAKGAEFLPASSIQLTREVGFKDSNVLANEAEEQLLYRDMQADMVQQIMRRLASAQPPKPAVQ
jgi:LPS-assembly lipoprotein